MKKMSFDEVDKKYREFISKQNELFFQDTGWTNKEYFDCVISEQFMVSQYNDVIKPLIDSGQMYLN